LRTRHCARARAVERIQPLPERRFQHPVLASVEQQVEHEGAVQLASGHKRERAGAEALAEDPFPQTAECGRPYSSLCAISSSSERVEDEMAPGPEVPELLGERDDAERVVQ
jgi:hypothetical protein